MVLSPLEKAALEAASALHSSKFGQKLRTYRAQRSGPDYASELASYEVGGGHPPVIRTLYIMSMTSAVGQQIRFKDVEEEQYFLWVGEAMGAINRVSTYLWADIPGAARQVVLDEDDLAPWATDYAIRGRHDDSERGLALVGISADAVAAVQALAQALSETPCYRAAASEARRLTGDSRLRAEMLEVRERTLNSLQGEPSETLEEGRLRVRDLVAAAYSTSTVDARRAAVAIRALNELINYVLWTLLSAAESRQAVPTIGPEAGAVRVVHSARWMTIRFATHADAGWLSPPEPFSLALASPIDGVYVTQGMRFQWGSASLYDLAARSLREMELAPA